jgi:hypothetical protein
MEWTPGQHVFVRFATLGMHALTSHPFTICSLPAAADAKKEKKMEMLSISSRQVVSLEGLQRWQQRCRMCLFLSFLMVHMVI